LYIKRVLTVLEDFLFFSLYSFSCIASSSTTLKDILILVPSIRTSSSVPQHPYHLRQIPPVTHPGGRLLRARRQYHVSRCISPSDRRFAVSSRSVGLQFQTNTLALWPTVTIRRNGFIGYTLASGLQCRPRSRKTSSHYTKYTLYLSHLSISLALSTIWWIHAIA